MSRQCAICGKIPQAGNKVSHSKRRTRTLWMPNLQSVYAVINGEKKKINACTKCIRGGKVIKPTVRTKVVY